MFRESNLLTIELAARLTNVAIWSSLRREEKAEAVGFAASANAGCDAREEDGNESVGLVIVADMISNSDLRDSAESEQTCHCPYFSLCM